MPRSSRRRRVCFVTGTRAEFGLMEQTLRAIAAHPKLRLQIVVTGMHLDRTRGNSARLIASSGWKTIRTVPWPSRTNAGAVATARSTGSAMSGLATVFHDLQSDIVLIVGDRVEAFAAASAAHIAGLVVAHVHGGDRALGQVDDSLRHAITKLAHVHFPATKQSADRIAKLGEHRSRIHRVGSPGMEGIRKLAAPLSREAAGWGKYALVVVHPVDDDVAVEFARATMLLNAVRRCDVDHIAIVYPNNDPGSAGIIRAWKSRSDDRSITLLRNLSRGEYLALLKRAAVLVGNSSSGIIEAASFGVPVVDIGPRQLGRECGDNVVHVRYSATEIERATQRAIQARAAGRVSSRNVYGGAGTAQRIANVLAKLPLDDRFRRKLISY